MMPAVTVPARPNGLPTATTQSPTRMLSELPHAIVGNERSASILSTARSVFSSLPIRCAVKVLPSFSVTSIFLASPMTWLLVTTTPSLEMMKPEPSEAGLGARLRRLARLAMTELLEEVAERAFAELLRQLKLRAWRRFAGLHLTGRALLGGDLHHRRGDLVDQVGEALRRRAGIGGIGRHHRRRTQRCHQRQRAHRGLQAPPSIAVAFGPRLHFTLLIEKPSVSPGKMRDGGLPAAYRHLNECS